MIDKDQFAVDNFNLIYKFINYYNISYLYDEIIDVLYIGFAKALRHYDKNKGQFSTIAFTCMRHEFLHWITYNNQVRQIPKNLLVSLNTPIGEEKEAELIDFIPDTKVDVEATVNEKILLNYLDSILSNRLSKGQAIVFKEYYLNNKTISEIAANMHISKQAVNEKKRTAMKRILYYTRKARTSDNWRLPLLKEKKTTDAEISLEEYFKKLFGLED